MNFKSIYPTLLLTLFTVLAFGQKIDTVYYNADWKVTEKQNSSYYRIAKTIEPKKKYEVTDYFNSGKVQMTGTYSSLSPDVEDGLFTWYYESGNKKSENVYENGKCISSKSWNEDGTTQTVANLEKQPSYPGGMAKLYKYIGKNFLYPPSLAKVRPKGTIILTFVVDKEGGISDVEVTQSVHPLMDAEAVRVVKDMPKWEPGIQFGKPVRVKYTIPIKMG